MSRRGKDAQESAAIETTTDQHCKMCSNLDDNSMVQCDKCNNWYHFICVGVTADIEYQDWLCPECEASKGARRKRKTSAKAPPTAPPVSTIANIVQENAYLTNKTSEAVQLDASVYDNRSNLVNVDCPTTAPVVSVAQSMSVPPLMYTPTVTHVPSIPLATISQIDETVPPRTFDQSIPPSLPSVTAPLTLLPPTQSQFSYVVLPPNSRAPGYYSRVYTQAQCDTVHSSAHPIPSLQFNTPLSSRNVPNFSLPGKTYKNIAPVVTGNNPFDNKKQGREEVSSQFSGTASTTMSKKEKRLQLELQILDEERKLQEEEQIKKREYLQKKHCILREMADESTTEGEEEGEEQTCNYKVNQWMRGMIPADPTQFQQMSMDQQRHYSGNVTNQLAAQRNQLSSHTMLQSQRYTRPFPGVEEQRAGEGTRFLSWANNTRQNAGGFNPARRSTPRQTVLMEDDGNNLSRSQIAARKAVSRELPSFSGTPEEWPLFYSTFITTTNMCGYTSEENLVRLQKSLKGKAYEAVKCRLMHPSNVPGIISTLNMLYGNPEVIVHNLIAKIKTTPPPKPDRLDTLVEFSLAVRNLCATIEACQLDEYSYNVVLLRELVDKLPTSVKVDWAKHRQSLAHVNLTTFSAWLYDLAEAVCPIATLSISEPKAARSKNDTAYLNAHTEQADDKQQDSSNQACKSAQPNLVAKFCLVCKGGCPSVEKCSRFTELGYNSRWAAVKELGLCRKCLRKHKAACKSQQVCGKNGCQFKHHPLLHNNQRDNTKPPNAPRTPKTQVSSATERDCNTHIKSTNKMLFRVAPVILHGPEKTVKTYAFLDDGSSLTLMDAALATELQLSGKAEPLCLRWTSSKSRLEKDSQRLNVDISGTGESHKKYRLHEVHTVSSLDLFHQSVDVKELANQYPYLQGIPVESYQDIQPRILIGIDNANLSFPLKGREGGLCQPIATKTRLGWIIHGGTEPREELLGYHSMQKCSCGDLNDSMLQRAMCEYFSIESIGVYQPKQSLLSTEDQRAIDILKTFTQDKSGHYISRLLWKYDDFHLPNSKPMALQRWRCLESRLSRDPELSAVLQKKFSEYLEKGYIRKLTEEELSQTRSRVWYLPIFPVFNPNKPGKVRIVWDAAAKSSGVSLNSMLLTGPDQLTSLVSVLIQFRENKVAICGDVREMFHQVWVAKEDQDCQRFFWREKPTDVPDNQKS